jgi:hypothetical protein
MPDQQGLQSLDYNHHTARQCAGITNTGDMTHKEIAQALTKARGIYYQTSEPPTFEDLLEMVEEADNALADSFGRYDHVTIQAVVRKMLKEADSASRICANPHTI